jgi:hypothetical protein
VLGRRKISLSPAKLRVLADWKAKPRQGRDTIGWLAGELGCSVGTAHEFASEEAAGNKKYDR